MIQNNYMCGILYAKRLDNKLAWKLIQKRYNKQKSRGIEGYGFVELNNGKVGNEFRSEEEDLFEQYLKGSKCDEILAHHRFPTSTPNFIEATHPIKVSNKLLKYNYYVVHNGIITNDYELKQKHNEMGFKYTTEMCKKFVTSNNIYTESMWNDSEALAIDLALSIENGKEIEARGNIAFIAIQYEKKTKQAIALYFGRNYGNPLKIEHDNNILCLSSETGRDLKANILNRYDYITGELTETPKLIGIETNYNTEQYGFSNGCYKDYFDRTDEDDFDWAKPETSSNKLLTGGKKTPSDAYFAQAQSLYDDIKDIKEEIKRAQNASNYDLEVELQAELEDLEIELNTLWNMEEYE